MDNKSLSESAISDTYIRPAIVKRGGHTLDHIYAQYPLRAGRVMVRGENAKRDQSAVLCAKFVVFLKPKIPLVVIEAKKSCLSARVGMQQAGFRIADPLQRPTVSQAYLAEALVENVA